MRRAVRACTKSAQRALASAVATGGWTNSGPGAMAHDLQSNLPPYAALPHIIWT